MARFIGQLNDQEQLLAFGQASVVVLPKADLIKVLKAGSATPLDEASAALALLCEAGLYDAVLQYGNPLLKAASAAVPFSPLGVVKHPIPHLEHLASDLALSIALAHISLAGGAGAANGSGGGSTGVVYPAAVRGSGSGGAIDDSPRTLEQVYDHLESALQVLERHSVAAPLQQEVSFCLQGVAAAFAEAVLLSTPPVSPPTGATSAGAVAAYGSSAAGTSSGAAARRAKALSALRSVLWRGILQGGNHHNHGHQAPPQQQQQPQQAQQDDHAPAATAGSAHTETGWASAAPAGGSWAPELTAEERNELMTPLRGLMAASEHIALYGPVASGQRPYGAVNLSYEELYDLAIAHLAQGVSTGWPQHVLQALTYFERIAQQQQHREDAPPGGWRTEQGIAGGAAAVDVSFERSVCEALLGRRTAAAVPPAHPPAPTSASPGNAAAVKPPPPASEQAGVTNDTGGCVAASATPPLPYGLSGESWSGEGDEWALLRRLEAQLRLEGLAGEEGALSFSVDERGDVGSSEYDDGGGQYGVAEAATRNAPPGPAPGAACAAAPLPGLRGLSAPDAAAQGGKASQAAAMAISSAQQQQQQQQRLASGKGPSPNCPHRAGDVAHLYGWAESWLELSVMPCFPETAAAGRVSLARWFADPRVILFNKLLAVRSGEAQVTAALGSAVAHVSDASRQRLWQLWQAAAHAVSSARGQPVLEPQTQPQAAEATGIGGSAEAKNGGAASAAGSAPLASGLLAQSRAALQDVAPRAAAAANAVAAAAARVGSAAAASSPRAVAAAAGLMAPFGFVRWGSAEKPGTVAPGGGNGGGGNRTAVAAQALPRAAAAPATEQVAADASSAASSTEATDGSSRSQLWPGGGAGGHSTAQDQGHGQSKRQQQQQAAAHGASSTNNVVPFPSGLTGFGSLPAAAPVLPSPHVAGPAAPPMAGGLVDLALAAPPAGGNAAVAETVGDAAASALWAPDAEGHLRPRPRMVAGSVRRVAADAAAGVKNSVAPVRDWAAAALDPAAALDEVASREAVRRVATVAAQAVCLGALAAYVGHRIVASVALQAAVASGYGAAAASAAPAVDASAAQVAAATRAVAWWLGTHEGALGQWPMPVRGAGSQVELGPLVGEHGALSAKSLGRLAEQYGGRAQLDEAAAAALLRGWAAARAAVPALTDPRDRSDLLSGLLDCRALRAAQAEADRNASMGRRMNVQRIEAEVELLRGRMAAAAAASSASSHALGSGQGQEQGPSEVVVTAAVVTAGTETSRASPQPLSYCTRERVMVTFRRTATAEAPSTTAASVAAAHCPSHVWRIVDVRDAPPALY